MTNYQLIRVVFNSVDGSFAGQSLTFLTSPAILSFFCLDIPTSNTPILFDISCKLSSTTFFLFQLCHHYHSVFLFFHISFFLKASIFVHFYYKHPATKHFFFKNSTLPSHSFTLLFNVSWNPPNSYCLFSFIYVFKTTSTLPKNNTQLIFLTIWSHHCVQVRSGHMSHEYKSN